MKLAIALFATFSVHASDAAAQPLSIRPTLHTPDAIAPAVLPYLACLYAERGLPLLRGTDGKQVPYEASTKGCAAARARAQADAAKLLEGKPLPEGTSVGAFIEQTLADMDDYVASLPMRDKGAPETDVVGIPVTIEDEVQPAYARYDECLRTQVSGSPVTADTVVAKFRQAMSICASIRAYAVQEATKALVDKGWDEATRSRAAASTFDKIDESWLAMGRQYEAVLQRPASLTKKSEEQQRTNTTGEQHPTRHPAVPKS